MTLLGIDIGTTHLKAGLFEVDGSLLFKISLPNTSRSGWSGIISYDPDDMWDSVRRLLVKLDEWWIAQLEKPAPIQAVGVASMAETGLLLDARTGAPRTPLIPWFETCATAQTLQFRRRWDQRQVFLRTGLHISHKYSLMKLLWLRDTQPDLLPGARWLSAADYIVHRLTGAWVTDWTLAERTGAFFLGRKEWDIETLEAEDLPVDLFPPVLASGQLAGRVISELGDHGIKAGVPVAVTGHDHVCGAFAAGLAAGSLDRAQVFDSMGTAEAFIGMFPERPLRAEDEASGFSMGLACAPGSLYWQGGLSTSGGSIEWLRAILGVQALTYTELDALLDGRAPAPTGILYFPYLTGSGSPHSDSLARGAFLGLNANHRRADLYQAVLEGCAYEMEYQRRAAERVIGGPINQIVAAGGGTRNKRWMQIKANIFGCPVETLEQEETTLLGAALLAGIGAGVYPDAFAAGQSLSKLNMQYYRPDEDAGRAYKILYENGYSRYEEMIRGIRLDL